MVRGDLFSAKLRSALFSYAQLREDKCMATWSGLFRNSDRKKGLTTAIMQRVKVISDLDQEPRQTLLLIQAKLFSDPVSGDVDGGGRKVG